MLDDFQIIAQQSFLLPGAHDLDRMAFHCLCQTCDREEGHAN
jgi:hypothetical protein